MKLKKQLTATNSPLENLIEYVERSFKQNHNQLTDQFLVFCRALNVGDINADNIQQNNVEAFLQVMLLIQSTNSHPLHAKFDSLITMLPTFVQQAYQAYKAAKNKSTNTTDIDRVISKLETLSQFIDDENLGVLLAFCYGLKSGTLSNIAEHADNIGIAFHALYSLETKLNQEQSELINIINECKALLPLWFRECYQKIVGKVTAEIMQDRQMIPSATAPAPAPKHFYPYRIFGNSIFVSGQFDNNAIVRFFSLCEAEKLEPSFTRRPDGFTLNNTAENTAIYERLLIRFLAPTLMLVDPAAAANKKSKTLHASEDVTVYVRGNFQKDEITQFMSLCIEHDLKPIIQPDATGFSISDYPANISQHRVLVQSLFGLDIETNSPAVTNNLRFSTNSVALREAQPASIDKDDLKRRNPFSGKSIFIPGEINDAMMVVFEAECFNYGLMPEYRLMHDGCFIQDGNNDEQNLPHYVHIMKNIMMDRSANPSLAKV